MSVENDLIFRTWATEHGGVYVPISPASPPNPYLDNIDKNILPISPEKTLTLINPAYIMRQVQEVRTEQNAFHSRLTSTNAINPINAADTWEAKALNEFAQDHTLDEFIEITEFNHQAALRLIQPFYIEEGCLKCHAQQGYKIGDLRGGISSSIPLQTYNTIIYSQQRQLIPGYLTIWIVGLTGIACFIARLRILTADLRKKEIRNRVLVKAIPDVLIHYNKDGIILNAEIDKYFPIFQAIDQDIKAKDFINQNIEDLIPHEKFPKLKNAINKVITTGQMQLIEHQFTIGDKHYYIENRLILGGEDEVISIIRDVTEQKNFEARLEYLSFHDELTHLYNRNYFTNELERLTNSREYPISIIMADVNGLKTVNDTLGHPNGDKLLINCAQILKNSLRTSDILARVGGDEFIAILPKTSEKEGQEIIQRIKNNLQKHNEKNPYLPISLAIGIDTATDNSRSLADVYKNADNLMYEDKITNTKLI